MKRTIIEFQPSDRNIVLFTLDDKLIGVNYWQGMGDMSVSNDYMSPEPLINISSFKGKPLSIAIEYIDIIDDLIWKSIEVKPTYIPQGQRDVIKKALKFYLDVSKQINSVPTSSEEYLLFDMFQLQEMMNYPISIEITEYDKDMFASKHGVDFPNY